MPVPLPVIANVFRCALNWTAGSQTAVNVIHIFVDPTGTQAPSEVFEALDDFVTQAMWTPVSSSAGVASVDITPLDGVTATASFSTAGAARWTGSEGGDIQVAPAAIVKMQTALRGRSHRGRIFLPFLGEGATSGGQLVGGRDVTTTAAWAAFQTALQGDAVSRAVVVAAYDRRHAGAGAAAHFVTSFLCELELGTQRRRQGRLR